MERRFVRLLTPMRVVANYNGWCDGHLWGSCDGCGQPNAVIHGMAVGAVHTERLCGVCFDVEQVTDPMAEEVGR